MGYDRCLYRRAADRGIAVLGVGCSALLELHEPAGAWEAWRAFLRSGRPSLGFLSYDLRLALTGQRSRFPLADGTPLLRWFVPEVFVAWSVDGTAFWGDDPVAVDRLLERLREPQPALPTTPPATWTCASDRATYLERTGSLLTHIQRGDIYEVNYCVERNAQLGDRDPRSAFMAGMARTDAPFAAYHAWDGQHALCLSPERFLWTGEGLIHCEPMKGTSRRSSDPDEDQALAAALAADPKERAENIMATDVVRNDLSRVAVPGSVVVPELCGIRSSGGVHQMVSRVDARLAAGLTPAGAVEAAFPMASMTGAPKHRAMELIDQHEDQRRGLFSGSFGWCDAAGDLDLNVVIRTVEHDARTGRGRLVTGSALTAACDPEREWEECALKASSVTKALGHAGA